jgi:hypothetical protein
MREALSVAAVQAEETGGLGRPGRPVNKRSPFFIGMTAAAGVAVTYGVAELTIRARSVLVLIGLALFIAIGLDPVVAWLTRRRVPRWAAVVIILAAVLAIGAAFMLAAIPPLVAEAKVLATQLPHYVQVLESHNSGLGRLNARFHVQEQLTHLLTSRGSALASGVLGAGALVLSAASSAVIVVVLVIYFLADLPRIKLFGYGWTAAEPCGPAPGYSGSASRPAAPRGLAFSGPVFPGLARPAERLRRHSVPVGHLLAWVAAESAAADGPP